MESAVVGGVQCSVLVINVDMDDFRGVGVIGLLWFSGMYVGGIGCIVLVVV